MTIYSLDVLLWNQSVVPCPVPTVASWPAYRFLRRQVRWSAIPISLRIFQFVAIHTTKGFSVVNEADVLLEFSCFFYDPNMLKYDAVKVLHSVCQKIWKTQQWPQDWKKSVFIPIPRKDNAKECSNYRTVALISHASKYSKFSKPGFSNMWTVNFLIFKLVLEKAEEPEIKLPTSNGSWKKQESSMKHLFLLYWLCQSLWLCGSQSTVENSERDGNSRPPDLPLEKPVCRSGSNS